MLLSRSPRFGTVAVSYSLIGKQPGLRTRTSLP
jgi:hypothetical protein